MSINAHVTSLRSEIEIYQSFAFLKIYSDAIFLFLEFFVKATISFVKK